jgi:hypothetical protein
MPFTRCPRCGRQIAIEPNEMELLIECASCSCRFTPLGGAVGEAPAASAWDGGEPPVHSTLGETKLALTRYFSNFDDDAEPWYYRHIETYAKLVLWIGIILIVFWTLVCLTFSLWMAASQKNPLWFLLAVVGVIFQAILALFFLLLFVAFVLLILDSARNLRATRQAVERIEREKR